MKRMIIFFQVNRVKFIRTVLSGKILITTILIRKDNSGLIFFAGGGKVQLSR